MSAESTLYGYLSGHAALVALVGDRIYPDVMPEGTAFPAIVFARTGTEPTYSLAGALMCEDVSFVVGVWGTTRDSADDVADAIVAALHANGERMTAREPAFDPEVGLYATNITVTLLVNP